MGTAITIALEKGWARARASWCRAMAQTMRMLFNPAPLSQLAPGRLHPGRAL